MTYELETIEDSIVQRLEPLKDMGVRTIDCYAGQLEAAEELAEITAAVPAVWVVSNGLDVEPVNRVDQVKAKINIIVADRNLRGPKSGLRGDRVSPGVFAILEAVNALLNGIRVIDHWSAFEWQGDDAVLVGPRNSIAIYNSRYQVRRMKGR
jgi:phage gp37-like protein